MPKPIGAQIRDAQALMEKRAESASGALMLEFAKRVVDRTPVDTGRARSNWQAGVGAPNRSVTNDTTNGAVIRAQGAFRRVAIGQKLYFTNTLPYIRRLEYDRWSDQAPGGMVRLAMAELQGMAREVAAVVKRVN